MANNDVLVLILRIVPFVVAFLFFLLVRRIVWWYFGIDRALAALEALAWEPGQEQVPWKERVARKSPVPR